MDTEDLYKLPNEVQVGAMTLPGDNINGDNIQRVKDMEPRQGDVVIATYPRSGTTWIIEAVDAIMKKGDISSLQSVQQYMRAPYLEFKQIGFGVARAEQIAKSEKRLMKTHLPFQYVRNLVGSDLVKTVVVMRNPKDMLVSLYHFYKANKLLGWFDKSWDHFFQLFQQKKLVYGDWLDHVESYWKNCGQSKNVLFVQYEDAKMDIQATLQRIADFLEIPLDGETLKNIAAHIEFTKMKGNPMTNLQDAVASGSFKYDTFIRQGSVGGWKNVLTVDQNEYVDKFYMRGVEKLGIVMRDV